MDTSASQLQWNLGIPKKAFLGKHAEVKASSTTPKDWQVPLVPEELFRLWPFAAMAIKEDLEQPLEGRKSASRLS